MIDIRDGKITDILPMNLASQPETRAFAYALQRQIKKLCDMADRVRILAALDQTEEPVLDYLAIELRTPCYDMAFPIETKRNLIASTLAYHMKMGTTWMVNSIITTIFGGGHIQEFFECGLPPHYFKIHVEGKEATTRSTEEFREILDQVKRRSQRMDGVELVFDQLEQTERVGGALCTHTDTPIKEEPDNTKFEEVLAMSGNVATHTETKIKEA